MIAMLPNIMAIVPLIMLRRYKANTSNDKEMRIMRSVELRFFFMLIPQTIR